MQFITLIRHADTEMVSPTGLDKDRSLTEYGHIQIEAMAKNLAGRNLMPDRILFSSAQRTRQSFEGLKPFFPGAAGVQKEALYLANEADIIITIEEQIPFQHIIVIGHNPGLHALGLKWLDQATVIHSKDERRLRMGFETAAAVHFSAKYDKQAEEIKIEAMHYYLSPDI